MAESFIFFVDSEGTDVTASTFPAILQSSAPSADLSLTLLVRITVRDCIKGVHKYTPSYNDCIQMIVTDIQNCPFVQLPLDIRVNGEYANPQSYIWNFLQSDDNVIRAVEVGLFNKYHGNHGYYE